MQKLTPTGVPEASKALTIVPLGSFWASIASMISPSEEVFRSSPVRLAITCGVMYCGSIRAKENVTIGSLKEIVRGSDFPKLGLLESVFVGVGKALGIEPSDTVAASPEDEVVEKVKVSKLPSPSMSKSKELIGIKPDNGSKSIGTTPSESTSRGSVYWPNAVVLAKPRKDKIINRYAQHREKGGKI
ncbi:MAG: hypothetical protein H6556_09255 [Lewinellaceae bacterium]|nr:hypothetical protein [Lewinellaceae bacterium]